MIKIKVDQEKVKKLAARLRKYDDKIKSHSIIGKIAVEIKNRIFTRTVSGKDANNKKFKGYSPEYRAIKGTSVVNLSLTGKMLNSMTQKVLSNTTAEIFFLGDQGEKAYAHNTGAGNLPQRKFFAVGKEDKKTALETYQEAIAKAKKDLGL